MEKKKKNNAFRWILHFAGQCRGRLTASVLLGHIGFCLRRCSLSGGDANHHPNPWKKLRSGADWTAGAPCAVGLSRRNLAEHSLHHAQPPLGVYDTEKYSYRADCKAFPGTNGNHFGYAFRKL